MSSVSTMSKPFLIGIAVVVGLIVIYYVFIKSSPSTYYTQPSILVTSSSTGSSTGPANMRASVNPISYDNILALFPVVQNTPTNTPTYTPIPTTQCTPSHVIQVASDRNPSFQKKNLCLESNSNNEIQLQKCNSNTSKFLFLSKGVTIPLPVNEQIIGIPPGQLVSSTDLTKCMSATSAQSVVIMATCDENDNRQKWKYDGISTDNQAAGFGFYNLGIPASQLNVYGNNPGENAMVYLLDSKSSNDAVNQFKFGPYTPYTTNLI